MAIPQLQWDLTQTSDSALSITKGLIRAATSDNVQILAVTACEKFGATLAICQETRRKVEHQILNVHSRKKEVVRFMNSVIGYSQNDCANQLARSLAGIQFLCLASALVPSLTSFEAGEALAKMLEASASDNLDKTLLPPARHLKDLLNSLEHHCMQLRFSDLVVGWQVMLRNLPSSLSVDSAFRLGARDVPNAIGLEKLIDAFRQLERLGDAISVTLKASSCAPWIAAFTQWCLGVPPALIVDGSSYVLHQPNSKVTLILACQGFRGLEITISRTIGAPSELIICETMRNPWTGMLSLPCYGKWLLQECGLDSEMTLKVLASVLPYTLTQVVATLKAPQSLHVYDQVTPKLLTRPLLKRFNKFASLVAYPFPKDATISRMMSYIIGCKDIELLVPPDQTTIKELPAVRNHLNELRKTCNCASCNTKLANLHERCQSDQFISSVALLTAQILALSLFDHAQDSDIPLLVRPQWGLPYDKLYQNVEHIIRGQFQPSANHDKSDIFYLLETALNLVGHTEHKCVAEIQNQNWVMSSYKGQAVYPRIYETQQVDEPGWLVLNWAPGLLRYEDEDFHLGVSEISSPTHDNDFITVGNNDPVTGPCNLAQDMGVSWEISRGDGILNIMTVLEPLIQGDLSRSRHLTQPFMILRNLTRALIIEACPHAPSTSVQTSDPLWSYSGPLEPIRNYYKPSALATIEIDVVAVEGDQSLRMFTLSNYKLPVVLRKRACLECCLKICQEILYPAVIC